MSLDKHSTVAVIGAGTMGTGIAQIASTFGHRVHLYDVNQDQLEQSEDGLVKILNRQVEKERMTQDEVDGILSHISFTGDLDLIEGSKFVIEAIIENLEIKQDTFQKIEQLVDEQAILASNTSSLSIASISSSLEHPERFLGIHFFNPAPLMKLVEIIPGISTSSDTTYAARSLIDAWGKTTVQAKDTPGFIVNRVARPFYGEALRIYEEGVADHATIDWAMKELGGFKMGPFELMDLIGHDVNYKVTESVFKEFYYDPRFKPSFAQKRLVEAGRLGRKTGIGFYDYREDAPKAEPSRDKELGENILNRILAMLINEAADAVFMNVASVEDVDQAMTNGVNYPKGLLKWADEIGIETVYHWMNTLQVEYREDRYRPNPLLKRKYKNGETFYGSI
ncbi:3-hydroxyacyl-CoA dehydrogenase NAD-binding domain-containing protein [Rhodohalobacter halophilus]|uniref:3-hydroxyacyl-CoA dehydrogenase NAD-binding domain-containing protein n=1 Tax=Rhodohalobacter halophilus TaxID=1812810 RepID=UPI00083F659A|nr:3-hydroxyacyl-CoA dehydrogenase NAD-binding domain-containing protein [Rhodohalobacter halophilus]